MPNTKLTAEQAEAARGTQIRVLYLDKRGREQHLAIQATATEETGLTRELLKQAMATALEAIGCTLLSVQVLVQVAHPMTLVKEPAPEEPRQRSSATILTLVKGGLAVAAGVAAVAGATSLLDS